MNNVDNHCPCPNKKCPHHGICSDCAIYHHKGMGMHTYCKAKKVERFLRIFHEKITN